MPDDKKPESDSFPKHAMKENQSVEQTEPYEFGDGFDGEMSNERAEDSSAVKDDQKNICELERCEGSRKNCEKENTEGASEITKDNDGNEEHTQPLVLGLGVEEK